MQKEHVSVTTILLMVISFLNFLYNIFKSYLLKPECVNDRYLSVRCWKSGSSSRFSFIAVTYLFHSWRLLVHLYVISELYPCEEQRYLTVRYQKECSLTKNSIQRRLFAGRHKNGLTEWGTVLSSTSGLQSAFQRW